MSDISLQIIIGPDVCPYRPRRMRPRFSDRFAAATETVETGLGSPRAAIVPDIAPNRPREALQAACMNLKAIIYQKHCHVR
jgi:hypothetical protein